MEHLNFIDENDLTRGGKFFYPSVECGPISNEKAKEMLGFKSSDLNESIKSTIEFFKSKDDHFVENKKA